MRTIQTLCTGTLALFLFLGVQNVNAQQSPPSTPPADKTQDKTQDKSSTTGSSIPSVDGHKEGPNNTPDAAEAASKFRRRLPLVPGLLRGEDGLLSTEGQRAVQNQLVTGTNVKDPVTDTYPFTAGIPVEAVEPVLIPTEQFVVLQMKFNATVPALDQISESAWHFSAGTPFFSLRGESGGIHGIRSAAPTISGTGPLQRDHVFLFESFEYRLSRTALDSLPAPSNLTQFQTFDWNNHLSVKAIGRHELTARFSLFSQAIDFATLSDLVHQESTPDYGVAGGYLFLSDTYVTPGGSIIDSSLGSRLVHLRVIPKGVDPMRVTEQGATQGSYFDNLHRTSSRTEWRENVALADRNWKGTHRISFGGGLARTSFDSVDLRNEIVLAGEQADENFAMIDFVGSPVESFTSWEGAGWIQDVWAPARRASFTIGLRYDRTGVSGTNEWAPRLGFALLPFKDERTVIRGGFGIFYDMLALTAGTFEQSQMRSVRLAADDGSFGPPQVLQNALAASHLYSPHIIGSNVEIDHEFKKAPVLIRIKAEERLGRNLTLLNTDRLIAVATRMTLSDAGTSRYREVEATVTYRPRKTSSLNVSYIRSNSNGDLNTFTSETATFERAAINRDQYGYSRSDSPNRLLVWGELGLPGQFQLQPDCDIHSGFPYGLFDANNTVAANPDLGRFPTVASLDLGLFREFAIKTGLHESHLRLGFKVYNLTNHFNPREVTLTEDPPFLVGFLNPTGRSYRANLMFNF